MYLKNIISTKSIFFFLTMCTASWAFGPDPVHLGGAETFAILSKTGISTVPSSIITGDIGVSPIDASAITGFSLIADSGNTFATCLQVTGDVYAADYTAPTPSMMTTVIGDMEIAYTDAAGRPSPDFINLQTGDLSGLTLTPGLYTFGTNVLINSECFISGSDTDTWIFQITNNLLVGTNQKITLIGGALAKNIVWQVAGYVEVGVGAHFEGVILSKTAVHFQTGSSVNGRILAQTAVTLQSTTVTSPSD